MAASLHELAHAALAALARADARETVVPGGVPIAIRLSGPDLPHDVPHEIATPQQIASERPWAGAHRLVVSAPLIVLDLYWNADEPLRIMTFSRGDWERDLTG